MWGNRRNTSERVGAHTETGTARGSASGNRVMRQPSRTPGIVLHWLPRRMFAEVTWSGYGCQQIVEEVVLVDHAD